MNLAVDIVDRLLETGDPDPEEIIRQSQIGVRPDDFLVDSRPDGYPGGRTGNYIYSISYKRILARGKPLYLGLVIGCHDYNRTQSTSLVNFYIQSVPSWTTMHTGLKRGVKRLSPFRGGAKTRTHHGHRGVVAMDRPVSQVFPNLFEAAKYLLSLVKHNPALKYNWD